jgi:hypothetical protein
LEIDPTIVAHGSNPYLLSLLMLAGDLWHYRSKAAAGVGSLSPASVNESGLYEYREALNHHLITSLTSC